MLEIEVKCPVTDFDEVRRLLAAWGARAEPKRQEEDHYFNAPDRDFAKTDEALRLRRIGECNWLTYKGPKRDLQTKTRTEIEISVGEGAESAGGLAQMLVCLGYRPVAIVRKERICYHCQRGGFAVEITLDTVAELGQFVEVEIRAEESALSEAREVLLHAIAELGLTTTELRAYLELLLAKRPV